MSSVYNDTLMAEDMRWLVTASTHHIAGNLFVLRCQDEHGYVRNYKLPMPAFEQLHSMFEATLIEAREAADN